MQFHNALYGDAKSFVRKLPSFFSSYVPGVMNPHAKVVQKWSKFLAIFCLIGIFVDPLFFFSLYVEKVRLFSTINYKVASSRCHSFYLQIYSSFFLFIMQVNKCIVINWPLATTLALVRCVNDFIYFLNILLQVSSR